MVPTTGGGLTCSLRKNVPVGHCEGRQGRCSVARTLSYNKLAQFTAGLVVAVSPIRLCRGIKAPTSCQCDLAVTCGSRTASEAKRRPLSRRLPGIHSRREWASAHGPLRSIATELCCRSRAWQIVSTTGPCVWACRELVLLSPSRHSSASISGRECRTRLEPDSGGFE